MKIVLIGIQGAGKSTQGNLISEELKIPYLSTGHIFRELAKEKTQEGRYIKETINSGVLISDERTLEIVNEYLARPEYQKGYILDGFPRTLKQAENFTEELDFVFYFKVSDKEALWRISGRKEERDDETLKAIRKRIEQFHEVTAPVLDYYRKNRLLVDMDGEESVEQIHKEVMSVLQ